jgi:flagellar motor switch protein FliN/FliY
MTNQTADMNHHSFSSAFFNALVRAVTEASGSPWLIAALPDAESTPDESEPVRIRLQLDGSLHGTFLLEFNRAEAAMLASKLLGQPADEFGEEQLRALLKAVRTAMNDFRSAREAEFGAFTIDASAASQPPSERTNIAQMTAADDDGNRISVLMILDPVLTKAISPLSQPGSTSASVAEAIKAATGKATPDPVNLNLVMDVELNVTLRFGQRKLTLREVLDLTSGSVVELDRQVEEPVELLLDGVVIARGEAVVVDGNYGLRVTEVSRPVTASSLH